MRTIAAPFDWSKLEEWVVFVVKGLSWHHWQAPITPNYEVDVFWLSLRRDEAIFRRLFSMRAAQRLCEDVGAGTFAYSAAQGVDNPKVSVWELSIYGGIKLAAGGTPARPTGSKIGVMVGPRSIFDRADKRAMWLTGQLQERQ